MSLCLVITTRCQLQGVSTQVTYLGDKGRMVGPISQYIMGNSLMGLQAPFQQNDTDSCENIKFLKLCLEECQPWLLWSSNKMERMLNLVR